MTIFGTRPEAIKMAPVILELKKYPLNFDVIVAVTAQHRGMLDEVLEIFDISPDYDLNLMKKNQTLTEITAACLTGLEGVLKVASPDMVLVHGDTTTSFAASLAAFYQQIPVGHIEAGLRTGNIYAPFPEEINRRLSGIIANLHFAPTEIAAKNLRQEGKNAHIYVTGNTVIDALNLTVKKDFTHPVLDTIGDNPFILLTAHRRENLGGPLKEILKAARQLINDHPQLHLVCPVHPNPKISKIAYDLLANHERIHLLEPLDVINFHNIIAKAHLILTDSGGIQEEAPTFGVPVLVLRHTTERPEGVDAGVLKLVGTDFDMIVETASELLTNDGAYDLMAQIKNPYGEVGAASRIVEILLTYLK